MQVVFLIFAIFTVGMLIPFTMAGINFSIAMNNSPLKPEGYEWPGLGDMKMMMYSAVFFAVVEVICR